MKQTPAISEAQPAGAAVAQSHRHLGRAGAGKQIAGAHQIEKLGAAHPSPPLDGLALHQDDVRGRAPEGGQAQAQKEPEDLTEGRSAGGVRPCSIVSLRWYHVFCGPSEGRSR